MKNSPYICKIEMREKKLKNISQLFREKRYKNSLTKIWWLEIIAVYL
jgi:hypothetical protein